MDESSSKKPVPEPLPLPGDSLQMELVQLLFGKVQTWMMVAITLCVFAALEWARWLRPYPPKPILYTAFAAIAVIVAVVVWWRAMPQVRRIKLGRQGEIVVAQLLDELRRDGYQVFNDLTEDGYNIDHVVVGRAGIFAIETKTISKRPGSKDKVQFDGNEIRVKGFKPDRDPVVQARESAGRITEILRSFASMKIQVRPVVLYPGWYVEEHKDSDVWVLNETRFLGYLRHEPTRLSSDEVASLGSAFASNLRAKVMA